MSSAKWSRNVIMGLHSENGIIIKHFRMDEKDCNTDTFDCSKLYFFRTVAIFDIRKQNYKHSF